MKRKDRFKINCIITENNIKRLTKDYLDIKGYFHFPILQGLGVYRGIPDRLAIKNGKTIYIEVKKPGGKQTEHQIEFQADLEKAGGKYILITCFEDLIDKIM